MNKSSKSRKYFSVLPVVVDEVCHPFFEDVEVSVEKVAVHGDAGMFLEEGSLDGNDFVQIGFGGKKTKLSVALVDTNQIFL